jgi:gold/copper resistance efflux pump
VLEASRLRLRPILMTSLAFIMGAVPLVLASGAGAEMRQAMGIAVFAGMLGVTLFGLLLTPVFYVAIRKLALRREARRARLHSTSLGTVRLPGLTQLYAAPCWPRATTPPQSTLSCH